MTEREIFIAAIQEDQSKRSAWIDERCAGDVDLRRRITALLKAHAHTGGFMEQSSFNLMDAIDEESHSQSLLPAMPDQIGVYQIRDVIGKGGMGQVYRALHKELNKTIALKVLAADRLGDSNAVKRFRREMRAVGRLDHPHVVRAVDAGDANGVLYLAMELVNGVNLHELVQRRGPLPANIACELARQTALGLQFIHEEGLVHRDVKPSNLILANDPAHEKPIVKLLDLGLALIVERSDEATGELTTTNQPMGSVDYMAPEQARDTRRVDIRADIYSLGVTLFKLLTGSAPFAGVRYRTVMEKLTALAVERIPSVGERRQDLDAGLIRIIDKMMARDPDNRFLEPKNVAEALEPFCADADLGALLRSAEGMSDTAKIHNSTQATISHVKPATRNKPRAETCAASPNTTTAAAAHGPTMRARWPVVVSAALGFLALAAASVVFFLQTGDGLVRIEVNDPSLEVHLKGRVASIKGKKTESIRIEPGKLNLKITRDGFSFFTKNFVLERNGEISLKVDLLAKAKIRVTADGKVVDERDLPSPLPRTIPLWKLIDPGKDAIVRRPCRIADDVIHIMDGGPVFTRVPVHPEGSYRLSFRGQNGQHLIVSLPIGNKHCCLKFTAQRRVYLTKFSHGKTHDDDVILVKGFGYHLPHRDTYSDEVITVSVKQSSSTDLAGITVDVGERTMMIEQIKTSELTLTSADPAFANVPAVNRSGIIIGHFSYTAGSGFKGLTLTMLDGEARLLRPADAAQLKSTAPKSRGD